MVIKFKNKHYCEDYWSPGGSDCTLLAGKIAGINSNSRVLDIGCGSGCASINLALEFGSQCFAIDSEKEYVEIANRNIGDFNVSQNVKIRHINLLNIQQAIKAGDLPATYDLIVAEGGIASYVGLEEFFQLLTPLLMPESVFVLSDVIFREGIYNGRLNLPFEIPKGIREFYKTGGYAEARRDRSTESQYEEICQKTGLDKIFSFNLSRSHWRKFHTNLKNHAIQKTGPVQRDTSYIDTIFQDEFFFNIEAQKYIAYLYFIGKKGN